ncbi:MAG: methylmalonyl-CoA mutase family protein [Verrucomicrobiota bacterium]
MSSSETLLDEFPKPSYDDWKSAAEGLLKGAPFDKKMHTKTVEGITLNPIYRKDSTEGLPYVGTYPGQVGSPRGAKAEGYLAASWDSLQEITVGDPVEFNRQLMEGLASGQTGVVVSPDLATSLCLDPREASIGDVGGCGLSLARYKGLEAALKGLVPEAVAIHVRPGCAMVPLASFLRIWVENYGTNLSQIRGGFHSDPIGHWVGAGSLPGAYDVLMDQVKVAWDLLADSLPQFGLIGCSGIPFHVAGGSAVDELALVLAEGVEYLRQLSKRGLEPGAVAGRMVFTFALGSNFFMEIAKIRAARIAWAQVQESFSIASPSPMRAIGRTGRFNKTVFDPYVNMLRTTTESFSGVLGGLEGLTIGAFDECVRESDAFSRRISRNTHTILGEECELNRVVDPAGGSWYLESLTNELVNEAWKRFQEIESAGGIVDAFRGGKVAEVCARSRAEQSKRLNQRRFSLIGTNVYANPAEELIEARLPDYEAEKDRAVAAMGDKDPPEWEGMDLQSLLEAAKKGASVGQFRKAFFPETDEKERVAALPHERLAEDFERLRKSAFRFEEETGKPPELFLVNLGPLRKHKIRADFTRGFFSSGGFSVIYPEGFDSPESAVAALTESGAKVAVVCGTDDQYGELFSAFAESIKASSPEVTVVLAGHPGENEEVFRKSGMDEFLWVKSDNFLLNRELLEKAGVTLNC